MEYDQSFVVFFQRHQVPKANFMMLVKDKSQIKRPTTGRRCDEWAQQSKIRYSSRLRRVVRHCRSRV